MSQSSASAVCHYIQCLDRICSGLWFIIFSLVLVSVCLHFHTWITPCVRITYAINVFESYRLAYVGQARWLKNRHSRKLTLVQKVFSKNSFYEVLYAFFSRHDTFTMVQTSALAILAACVVVLSTVQAKPFHQGGSSKNTDFDFFVFTQEWLASECHVANFRQVYSK